MADVSTFPPSAEWSAVMPSYEWPRNTDEQDIDYVYHGRMENLPRSTSKIVRIFLSSTFTDTYTERNLLMKNVFPEMRQYCRDKYDLDLQVVDMRWGIREDATVDHSASELCMKEIKTCNELSLGPTFVTLLSHRYGSRPLRTRIPEQEMNILIEELKQRSAKDEEFMLQWYNLDTNAEPPEYILKPLVKFEEIDKLIQSEDVENKDPDAIQTDDASRNKQNHENQKTNAEKYKDLLKAGNDQFRKAETKLKQIFKELALDLLKEKRLTVEQAERYYISVTEEEIIEGIRKSERRRDRGLAFVRQLNDINLSHEKAWRFIDKTEDGKLDEEAQDLMTTLRDKTIPGLLPPENIFRFETTWSDNEGVNEKEHAEYLKQFCDTFKKALTDQIDRGVQASKFTSDKLFSEILEHGHQCVGKVERFYGRKQILDTIRDYIMSGSEQPLIIWGESGCGKTSVLAKAVKLVPEWLGDNKDLIIPVRFLGTTPESSTIYQTLASISQQIIKLCSLEEQFPELPQEFADLKDIFRDILAAVQDGKRIVLFLDSLDQLADTNSAHELHWFPQTIPKNVKIVVSVLPKEHGILMKLQKLLKEKRLYVEVPSIKTETSHEILKLWLKLKKRKLSEAQEKLVNELLKREVRPLYLKLVFDEIHVWKSYERPTYDCRTIEACLARLFKKIETKHGQVLVSKSLGYLSASSNGLTELEMEDILSLDEEALNDVYQFHIPPIRRLPSILWARIRRDLDEYIADREADGTKVMAWYHRQFIQEANKRYLGLSAGYNRFKVKNKTLPLFKNLHDYFAGTWAGDTPKPFIYSDWHCKRLKLTDPNSEAMRHVTAQPSIFTAPDGSIDIENPRYNLRKISELPEACREIDYYKDLRAFYGKHILFNPEFLCAYIRNKPWDVISEFITERCLPGHSEDKYTKIYKKQFEGIELTEEEKKLLEEAEDELKGSAGLALQMATIYQCLLLSHITVFNNPTILGADVSGRLLVYRGIFSGIDEWIGYCDTKGRQLCALVSPHLQLETPGNELLFTITNHDGPILEAIWDENDDDVCISLSSKFIAVSVTLGEVLVDTRPKSIPKGDHFTSAVASKNAGFIGCLSGKPWMYFFNENGGDVIATVKLEEELKGKLKELDAGYELKIRQVREINSLLLTMLLCLTFHQLPHLVLIYFDKQGRHPEKKMQFTVIDRTGKGDILDLMEYDYENIYIVDSNSELSKIKIHTDVLAESSEQKVEDLEHKIRMKSCKVVHKFSGLVRAHDVGEEVMILSISDGTIHVLSLREATLEWYQFDARNKKGVSKYGHAHFVKLYNSHHDEKLLNVACTASHLLLLTPKSGDDSSDEESNSAITESDTDDGETSQPGSDDDSDHSSKAVKKKELKSREMKLVFRVKRSYDMAQITPGCKLIIAARGGTVDLFQLSSPKGDDDDNDENITGRFFTTIDAHGRPITKILTTDNDVKFMTGSWDGTMKFWMVARAGVTRKYIPNFDRADVTLTQVLPDEETALACGLGARSVQEWNIVKGRIVRIFENPSKTEHLHEFVTDKTKSTIHAIGKEGTLFVWNLRRKRSASPKKSLKHKETPKQSVDEGRIVTTETPAAVYHLAHSVPLLNELKGSHQFDRMYVVSNGVVLTDINGSFYHIQIQGEAQVEQVSDDFALYSQWKINDRYILGLSEKSGAMVFRLYDAENKVVTDHYMKDVNPTQCDCHLSVILNKTGELIMPSLTGVTLWNPVSNQIRKLALNCKQQPRIVASESGVCLIYFTAVDEYRGFQITSDQLSVEPWTRKCNKSIKEVEFLTLTHDGKYILYVTDKKMLHLRRYSDGKLLALYTMHDGVCSLSVSTNNWFVILGTLDKRLFTLVIADPNEREHDDRITYVRTMNPGLSMEQAIVMMSEVNPVRDVENDPDSLDYDSSDNEAVLRVAEKRLDKRAMNRDLVFCLKSDESSSDSESETRPGTRQILTRENTVVQVYDNGLKPTDHDGEIFTPHPCSLQ